MPAALAADVTGPLLDVVQRVSRVKNRHAMKMLQIAQMLVARRDEQVILDKQLFLLTFLVPRKAGPAARARAISVANGVVAIAAAPCLVEHDANILIRA